MIEKIFKGVWFLSLAATVGLFMYVYAALPENVQLNEADPGSAISRDTLFYSVLLLLALSNAAVLVVPRLGFTTQPYFGIWLNGLVSVLNLFVTVSLQFLSLINSLEKYDYERLGIVIYGTLSLLVLWLIWWPVYASFTGLFRKQSI